MLRMASAALLVGLGVVACRGESPYEHYVHEACEQVKERQDEITRDYKLAEWERYDRDQDRQELVFSHRGVPQVIAKVQFVGSYSKRSNTWRWAWANDTVLPDMKADVVQVKELGTKKGWRRLTAPQWPATEQDGWDMTGVTLRVLNAKARIARRMKTG
jgi:hypothetical protein